MLYVQSRSDEKELKRLRAITTIHHNIGTTLELEVIARIVMRDIIDNLDCDAYAIILKERDELKVLTEIGFSYLFAGVERSAGMSAIKYIIETKQPIFASDIEGSPVAKCIPQGCSIQSMICVPLVVNEEVKGIIHLDSMKKNAFSIEDLEFAELIANETSIAIERSLLYSRVQDRSIRDGLTGCYNRRKFDTDVAYEASGDGQEKRCVSLLMLDVDMFKKYNDYHGHPMGDILLRKLVDLLMIGLRPLDNVYRYGGDEFAILLHNTEKEEAALVAMRLRHSVEQEKYEGEEESQPGGGVTVSIGVANYPSDGDNHMKLIQAADSALYSAKKLGGNRICIFQNTEASL